MMSNHVTSTNDAMTFFDKDTKRCEYCEAGEIHEVGATYPCHTNLKEIRDACIAANPDLLSVLDDNFPDGAKVCRPIHLADVLLAIEKLGRGYVLGYWKEGYCMIGDEYRIPWNLRKTLEDQDDAMLALLAQLLRV